MKSKAPVLTVIAGRPSGSRSFETTHRTARHAVFDVVCEWVEAFSVAVLTGAAILAFAFGIAVLLLSLDRVH